MPPSHNPPSELFHETIAAAESWEVVPVDPESLSNALANRTVAIPLVLQLKPGLYALPHALQIRRRAPVILRAGDGAVVFQYDAHHTASGGALLSIEGGPHVILQGITFDVCVDDAADAMMPACVLVDTVGSVSLSDCKFIASSSSLPASHQAACVRIRQCQSTFITQCEFVSGLAAVVYSPVSTQPQSPNSVPKVGVPPRSLPSRLSSVVVMEDCGLGVSESLVPLSNGIVVEAMDAMHTLHLSIEHSSFENIEGCAFKSNAATTSQAEVSIAHCTITRCGKQSSHSFAMCGRVRVSLLDTSIDDCATLLACHASTTNIKECLFTTSTTTANASVARQIVVQDRADFTAAGNELTLRGTKANCDVVAALLVLLSSGNISVERNVFRATVDTTVTSSPSEEELTVLLLAGVVVDGQSAPFIEGNTFQGEGRQRDGHQETDAEQPLSAFVSVLLGLWQDAKIKENQFGDNVGPDRTFVSMEQYPQATPLGLRSHDIPEWTEPEPAACMRPNVPTPQEKSASRSDEKRDSSTKRQRPKPTKPASKRQGERRPIRDAIVSPATASSNDDHDDIPDDDASDQGVDVDMETIEGLRRQVEQLKKQLHNAKTKHTMTNVEVRPPAAKRPTSARPSSARGGSSSRPSSGKPSRPSTAGKRSPADSPHGDGVDGRVLRIGEYKWNMGRLKGFMEGRVPLAAVRCPATPDPGHDSPHRSTSPAAIYDTWKRNQDERRRAEELLLMKHKEEALARHRKLTPQQQRDMVQRIHTESIEHLMEVREKGNAEYLERVLTRPRPATMKAADAVAEAAGEFHIRLAKDLKDRELRRVTRERKYLYEAEPNRRSREEIAAYTSSLYHSHHNEQLVSRVNQVAGVAIRVAPLRPSYRSRQNSAKKISPEDLEAYCASLAVSHRDERLAERAAAIAGEECVSRVGARSSSRR